MVSVVVVRPFRHLERTVYDGECIEMEPIEALVKAREGYVSLDHGRTYQTRDMVAQPVALPVTVESFIAASPTTDTPVKRRRGRPRKPRE